MIGWCSGGCTDENCILGGRVHRMKDPGICSTKRGFFWSSDRGPSSHGNTANGHNAPHKRPPNTLGLEENHILPWNTENGSCALGICDYCNEIGRNRWCTLVALWPRTLDGDKNDPNSLFFLHGLDTWGWHNGPGKTAHNIPRGLLHHILGVGTPASACCHLTQGHWEQEGELPCSWDCLQPVSPRRSV